MFGYAALVALGEVGMGQLIGGVLEGGCEEGSAGVEVTDEAGTCGLDEGCHILEGVNQTLENADSLRVQVEENDGVGGELMNGVRALFDVLFVE